MPRKLDHTGDAGHQVLHRIAGQFHLPEYVKTASPEILTSQDLPLDAYADPADRAFPCHTKAACFLSAAYLEENREAMPTTKAEQIKRAVDHFAARHGMARDVANFRMASSSRTKQASVDDLPDDSFAIVWKLASGSKDRRYPLRNAIEVKTAAEYAIAHRGSFHYEDRQRMAERILTKAAEFGATIPEETSLLLRHSAGYGTCDPKKASHLLRTRAVSLQTNLTLSDGLRKLASNLDSNALLVTDRDNLVKLAAVIDQADRAGMLREKNASLEFPEDVLFGADVLVASQFLKHSCSTATGTIYDSRQFDRLSPVHVASLYGQKFASDVTTGLRIDREKLSQAVQKMPYKHAHALDQMMSSIGEPPMLISTSGVGLPDGDRQRLADEYAFSMSLPDPGRTLQPSGS